MMALKNSNLFLNVVNLMHLTLIRYLFLDKPNQWACPASSTTNVYKHFWKLFFRVSSNRLFLEMSNPNEPTLYETLCSTDHVWNDHLLFISTFFLVSAPAKFTLATQSLFFMCTPRLQTGQIISFFMVSLDDKFDGSSYSTRELQFWGLYTHQKKTTRKPPG